MYGFHSRSSSSTTSPLVPSSSVPAPSPPYRNPSPISGDDEHTLTNRIRLLTGSQKRQHPTTDMSLSFVGSPDFSPQAPSPRTRRSRATSLAGSVDNRLSVIDEDQPSPPEPPQAHSTPSHRPFHQRFGLGEPPRYSNGDGPPKYSFWDITGPKGEKFDDLRNNAYIAKRGGLKRICLILSFLLILLIALAVGLGVGLSQKKKNNSPPAPASSPSPSSAPAGPFPAGSYTFTTYLTLAASNCTGESTAWTCQPSMTYSSTSPSSQAASKAQFNWIIASTAPNTFTISSTQNPFAIDFKDVPLSILDTGLATERYTFRTTVPKTVFPSASFSTQCFYNSTLFSGNLYTKKPPDTPPAAGGSTDMAFPDWKFAVDAAQSVGGGEGVPDCYNGGQRVTQGDLAEQKGAGDFCSCGYKNYDL
ncbi:uncharacterized protein KY384_001592 [Bacidia gigantensis]|uniref:uncharacterized protein n=1 Tax=Bacidia gigantensis TaxID=2732470 RepID=UPI001D04DB96|nr:uncharacterized protein KY384_001592 [Bacidia gigantensis]KAG8533851.1 hypothetical protein KY384_001592 [Bacidia gigantensis]